jgi:hypothetical protein
VFTNQGVVPYFIIILVFTQVVSVTDPVLLGSVSLGLLGSGSFVISDGSGQGCIYWKIPLPLPPTWGKEISADVSMEKKL